MNSSPNSIHFKAVETDSEGLDNGTDDELLCQPETTSSRSRCGAKALQHGLRHVFANWKILVFGQCLSFFLAASGAAQATLVLDCSLSAPTFTVGLCYFVLSFCLIPVYLKGRRQQMIDGATATEAVLTTTEGSIRTPRLAPHYFLRIIPLQAPAYAYLGMAVLDVYANYFTVLAFKYTTITSVTVFDALAIPSAMILSRCFLSRRYTWVHLLGVTSCMLGIVFNVLQDYRDDTTIAQGDNDAAAAAYPHKLRGDVLAITGGLMFGANNVLGEVAVRNLGGPNEYLGMLGFFATIICTVQTIILERDAIHDFVGHGSDKSETCSQAKARWLLLGFVVSISLIYMGVARFLQISEATFLNLGFLTGDLWSVGFSVIAEHIVPKPLFFVALVFIVSGVFVYELAPSPVQEDCEKLDQEESWREEEVNELELQVRDADLS